MSLPACCTHWRYSDEPELELDPDPLLGAGVVGAADPLPPLVPAPACRPEMRSLSGLAPLGAVIVWLWLTASSWSWKRTWPPWTWPDFCSPMRTSSRRRR